MSAPEQILVCDGLDDIRAPDLRFLEEAARLGDVNVLLWSDKTIEQITGKPPRFPLAERRYFLQAVRYVTRVIPLGQPSTKKAGRSLRTVDNVLGNHMVWTQCSTMMPPPW